MNFPLFCKSLNYALLTAACLMLTTCDKLELLIEDVDIVLDTDLLSNPLTVQFIDSRPEMTELLKDLTIEITGPDADKIYSVLGERKIEVTNRFANFGVKKTEIVSPENPLQFSIAAKAPGYLPNIQSFVITDLENNSLEVMPLVNLDQPPAGVSVMRSSFQAGPTGVAADVSFASPVSGTKQEKIGVMVPQGTKMYDAQGQELRGTVQVSLAHFDSRHEESLESFPGGFFPERLFDKNGNPMEPSVFTTAGFIALDMFVGGKEVKTFSKPLEVSMEIDPEMVNPETEQPIKPGDVIPVWSLNEETGEWREEGDSEVKMQGGKLVANFQQEHLSWWSWNFLKAFCTSFIQLKTGIPFTSAGVNYRWQFSERTRVGAGFRERLLMSGNARCFNNQLFYLRHSRNTGSNRSYRFRVIDPANGKIVAESGALNMACGRVNTVDFSSQLRAPINTLSVQINVSGKCEGGLTIRPTAAIFYRPSGSPAYTSFASLSSGRGTIPQLEKGKTYDFAVSFGPFSQELRGVTIPQSNSTLEVMDQISKKPQVLNLIYTNSQTLTIDYTNIPLSAGTCATWEKYFGG